MRTRQTKRMRVFDDQFVVGDNFVEYEDGTVTNGTEEIIVHSQSDMEESQESQDMEQSAEPEHETSMIDRFKRAVSGGNDAESALFFADIIVTKMKPALLRGNNMDQKRFDDLIIFVTQKHVKLQHVTPFSSVCDICKTRKPISVIITNGITHRVAGSFCARMLSSAISALKSYELIRKETEVFLEAKWTAFNAENNGDCEEDVNSTADVSVTIVDLESDLSID